MGAKKKKDEKKMPEIIPIMEEPAVVEEQEHVEFTETSYTTASWEDIPEAPPVVEEKPKKKKGKKEEVETVQRVGSVQWSEATFADDAIIESVVILPSPEPEKKGKKGKKVKEKEEIPDFEKPKEWNKMNKKQRAVWLETRIEEWRAELEAIRQAAVAGAANKRKQEAKKRLESAMKDAVAMDVRRDLLQKTCNMMRKFELQKKRYDGKKQMRIEWEQYMRCDGLPDPAIVTQMATFLHRWKESGKFDDDELDQKCIDTLPMLEILEEIVANSRKYTKQQAANYTEIRLQLRAQLAHAIECASYSVLRNIEKKMKFSSIAMCTYQREFKGLMLNLWMAVKMPTNVEKPKDPYEIVEPVTLEFPGISVKVTLPNLVNAMDITVRASRSLIDFLSETSRTYRPLGEIEGLYDDFFTYCVKEYADVQKKRDADDAYIKGFFRAIHQRTKEVQAIINTNPFAKWDQEKYELDELALAEPQGIGDPNVMIAEEYERKWKAYLKKNRLRIRSGELNLRKYRIANGVLYLDLLMALPQPKPMERGIELTTLELPKTLRWVNYKVNYKPPIMPEGLKKGEKANWLMNMKKDCERLALVYIELSHEVIWNEKPIIVQWQEQRRLWTSTYINEYEFDAEHLTVQFRTGVLWPIGLGLLKYCNMPYLHWDVRPDPDGKGVLIEVTGQVVKCTWKVVGNYVKLIFVANSRTLALKPHYHKKYSVKRMVQTMRDAACDFFPDFDSHNHIEGTSAKQWQAERHLYHAMAFLSRAYNFQFSKWNFETGYRKMVCQIRECVDAKREANLNLLMVTPQETVILKKTENMAEWNEEPMAGMQFFTDLFTLNMKFGSLDARRRAFKMKFKLVETLFEFLQELKLFSFSGDGTKRSEEEEEVEEEENSDDVRLPY